MKLLFGLFLNFLFFHSVYMLQCFVCDTAFCQKPIFTTCEPNQYCGTVRTDGTFLGFNFTIVKRMCLSNEICALLNANGTKLIASVAVGRTSVTTTISCCNTDGCNNNYLDAPNKTPNGLICKSCHSFYDEQCDSDMSCVGNQDRCFNDTASLLPYDYGFGNNTVKGCISRCHCQPSHFGNVSCCEGSYCNKAVSWLSEINYRLPLLSLVTVVLLV
ncbi:hypothetical protein QQF64_028642 [Cirrhinus molitorella]|uniref:UPAR/Ly6 domain-containing protein n=1 Tax=Cirrhinus molitorella TaxID=172907 RepID=A0ABR3N772_9TELE